jgi:hypothetical protein
VPVPGAMRSASTLFVMLPAARNMLALTIIAEITMAIARMLMLLSLPVDSSTEKPPFFD